MIISSSKIKGFILDKWPTLLGCLIAFSLFFYAYGCESKTTSLLDPQKKVNRLELQNQIEFLLRTGEIRFADLDKQDNLRQLIFNQGLIIAQGNNLNPLGVITTIAGVLGMALGVDNVRLRKQRKKAITYEPIKSE